MIDDVETGKIGIVITKNLSSGHRTQAIEIYWRFNVAVTEAVADRRQ